MNEIKITLQQLLSLYTGGRPVGVRDFSEQYEEFFANYSALSYIKAYKVEGKKQLKEADKINFKNMLTTIEFQFPKIKKIKKLCKEYASKVPTLYDGNEDDEKILESEEYKELTRALMKEAREVLGNEKHFVIKNLKAFGR